MKCINSIRNRSSQPQDNVLSSPRVQTQAPSCEVALLTVSLSLLAVRCPGVNVKDGSCLETESWPRIVCSGAKGTTEGEKDTVGSCEDLFGQFRSYIRCCAPHINTTGTKDKIDELDGLLLSADMNITGIAANYWGEDNQDSIRANYKLYRRGRVICIVEE